MPNNDSKPEKEKPSFVDRIIHGKGTVAEPWPSVKEVLNNPDVKKEIEEVKQAYEEHQKNGKK